MEADLNISRTIFIGDVHGMLDALDALLAGLAPTSGDRLIFLGDLVDKGPAPVGVVHRVGELISNPEIETVLLRGNHEDKHIRFRTNLAIRPKIAREMAQAESELPGFHNAAKELHWNVLEQAAPFWHDPDLNILAVHGGIPGNRTEFPFDWDKVETLSNNEQQHIKKIWLTRYVDRETGKFLGRGRETPNDPFWAEVYDGRFGHVVFGHEVFMNEPALFEHATGIDTGAVHGGALTALIVQPDGSRDFLSVSTAAN